MSVSEEVAWVVAVVVAMVVAVVVAVAVVVSFFCASRSFCQARFSFTRGDLDPSTRVCSPMKLSPKGPLVLSMARKGRHRTTPRIDFCWNFLKHEDGRSTCPWRERGGSEERDKLVGLGSNGQGGWLYQLVAERACRWTHANFGTGFVVSGALPPSRLPGRPPWGLPGSLLGPLGSLL